jgi:hypothetical protein
VRLLEQPQHDGRAFFIGYQLTPRFSESAASSTDHIYQQAAA